MHNVHLLRSRFPPTRYSIPPSLVQSSLIHQWNPCVFSYRIDVRFPSPYIITFRPSEYFLFIENSFYSDLLPSIVFLPVFGFPGFPPTPPPFFFSSNSHPLCPSFSSIGIYILSLTPPSSLFSSDSPGLATFLNRLFFRKIIVSRYSSLPPPAQTTSGLITKFFYLCPENNAHVHRCSFLVTPPPISIGSFPPLLYIFPSWCCVSR